MPGNDGESAGWVLTVRPPKVARKVGPTSFMKPASTTSAAAYDATEAVRASSHASREPASLTRWTNVGTPARSARARASLPSRSTPTATTVAPYDGSVDAASSAWRLVPEPDTRTTTRNGRPAAGRGTAGV